jgi:hypothetical protein
MMGFITANESHSHKIIISYDYDGLTGDGVSSSISVAVISAPLNPNFRISLGIIVIQFEITLHYYFQQED